MFFVCPVCANDRKFIEQYLNKSLGTTKTGLTGLSFLKSTGTETSDG